MRRVAAAVLLVLGVAGVALGDGYISRRDNANIPKDWGPLMNLHLRFEDPTNNDTTYDSAGNFGSSVTECSGCAITRTAATHSTNVGKDFWLSANFTAPEYFTCADATCDLDAIGSALTWGCWNKIASANRALILGKGTDDTAATGYMAFRKVTTNKFSCSAAGVTEDGTTTATNDQWWHTVCVADEVGDSLYTYVNGANDGGTATSMTGDIADSSGDFLVNTSDTSKDWDGYIDDCFVVDSALAATDICRICSLGVNGQRGECDSTTPTNYKACTSNSDCNGGLGVCTDAASEDNCADASERCCMGWNAVALTAGASSSGATAAEQCGDCDLPPCNQAGFTPPATVYPQSWLSSLVALYEIEADTGNLVDTSTGGLQQASVSNSGVTFATTAPVAQQSQYAVFADSAADRFSCATNNSCTDMVPAAGADLTWGMWFRPTAAVDATTDNMMSRYTSSTGYRLMRAGTGGTRANCAVAGNSVSSTTTITDPGTDVWYHIACRWDDTGTLGTGNQLSTQVRTGTASVDLTNSTLTERDATANSNTFYVGATTAAQVPDGDIDEIFLAKKPLTDEQICRACSIGWDGGRGRCDEQLGFNDYYKPCNSNTDCGGTALCDTGTSAQTWCGAGAGEYAEPYNGCCMGQNVGASTLGCGGCSMPACSAPAP